MKGNEQKKLALKEPSPPNLRQRLFIKIWGGVQKHPFPHVNTVVILFVM